MRSNPHSVRSSYTCLPGRCAGSALEQLRRATEHRRPGTPLRNTHRELSSSFSDLLRKPHHRCSQERREQGGCHCLKRLTNCVTWGYSRCEIADVNEISTGAVFIRSWPESRRCSCRRGSFGRLRLQGSANRSAGHAPRSCGLPPSCHCPPMPARDANESWDHSARVRPHPAVQPPLTSTAASSS